MDKVPETLNRLADLEMCYLKSSQYQISRLPFLRAQNVLNIRFFTRYSSPQTDYSVSFQAIFGARSYERDR